MLNEKIVNEVYDNLSSAKEAYTVASEKSINLNFTLDVLVADATQNGDIVGKNADARSACAKSLFGENYNSLEEAKNAERKARHILDLANLEVERVRALLRLQEVLK